MDNASTIMKISYKVGQINSKDEKLLIQAVNGFLKDPSAMKS